MGSGDGNIYTGWHIGNQCFVFVPLEIAEKIIVVIPELKIDGNFNFLEKSDLSTFKINDSVQVGGMLGNQKGKVYSITENELTIRKFHSQTKGWKFRVGEQFDVARI